ncbi:hypothetical protein AB5J72_00970 [Streptomyces sp. CG1]|uniref:hypothetical protein n=1 Tax=Streptomyces sp. CG1 TaxID=1287523 RepID=UPI0034E1D9CA
MAFGTADRDRISSGTAQKRACRKQIMPDSLGGQEDLAVSPDGKEIVTADGRRLRDEPPLWLLRRQGHQDP